MNTSNSTVTVETGPGIHISDITSRIQAAVNESGINQGLVCVSSQHTTTAVSVNEYEERLLVDIDNFFSQLVPADGKYLHNDLHLRNVPDDEPENAHSHLCAMMLGNSETLALVDGKLRLGTYQAVMLIELDGPRPRKVNVQIIGA